VSNAQAGGVDTKARPESVVLVTKRTPRLVGAEANPITLCMTRISRILSALALLGAISFVAVGSASASYCPGDDDKPTEPSLCPGDGDKPTEPSLCPGDGDKPTEPST
jgi:hypothetical protein